MSAPGLSLHGDLGVAGLPLLRNLALTIPAGRWSCLLGPSGVGKSTLGRLIAGLPGPYHWRGALSASDGLPCAGRVAMVAQDGQLLPWADLLANVTIGARLRGQRPDRARARALLGAVGLPGFGSRRPCQLSAGQRQRVALARILFEDSPIIVLDEAFSALDTATRLAMHRVAARLLAGRTVILITHDPLEALRMAESGWLLQPAGALPLDLPDGPVPRDYRAPEVQRAQAQLLARLVAMEPA